MEVSFVAYPSTLYSSAHHYAVYMIGTTPLTSRIIKPTLIDAETGAFTDNADESNMAYFLMDRIVCPYLLYV